MPYPGMRPPRFLRARRPRPSEKTAFRVISRFSPLGHASWACLPRGGAGSARPHGNALASPWHVPARPPASRLLLARHALPRACVRPCHPGAETAPLRENSLSRYLPVFPVRPCVLGLPPPGGAGSARPQRRHRPHPGISPLGPRPQRPRPHALRKDKLKPAR
jgi:hypothetical protein